MEGMIVMAKNLALLHTQADGTLSKAALETVTAVAALGGEFDVGIIGSGAAAAADSVQGCGAAGFYVVDDSAVAEPRYATDAAAATAVIKASGAELIVAAGTSRFARALPGAAYRCGAEVDTHVVGLSSDGGKVTAQRWFYRQRILSSFSREARPWMVLIDGGVFAPWEGAAGSAAAQSVAVEFGGAAERTTVTGVQTPASDAQTIRPDAEILFVAGAGWTKKQKDGQYHVAEAGQIILGFLERAKASLGSTKSLVDLQSEGQETLDFMTHMNQIGQTGSTPRHSKGLATCCHGEEPHAVGWRFISERRAISLDPNCGWSQGKADVVYVGDAFEIMKKVNELLG